MCNYLRDLLCSLEVEQSQGQSEEPEVKEPQMATHGWRAKIQWPWKCKEMGTTLQAPRWLVGVTHVVWARLPHCSTDMSIIHKHTESFNNLLGILAQDSTTENDHNGGYLLVLFLPLATLPYARKIKVSEWYMMFAPFALVFFLFFFVNWLIDF